MRYKQRQSTGNILSNCGEIRIRGSIEQVIARYNQLAAETDDRSQKEMYLQHVEHYTRMKAQHV